ncbi:2-oxo acid dehydrogenase subunit E2 [Methanobrevibacter sp. OttesenSCG-928-I08]|nr:2-oxo acid dehydrogenase subunit E2 [Methanobrevibacter sp. OttesenSCG-928-I08]
MSLDNNNSSRANKREKQKGDRWDGYEVKDIDPFQKLIPFLMKTRTGSSNYFKETYDATEIVKYLNRKNKELDSEEIKYNYNQFFIAAIVRIFALRPHLNRFIAGKKIYQRHNIDVAYVIKKEYSDEGEESVVVSSFERDSNIDDIKTIVNPVIKGVKTEESDDTGDFINSFVKLPNFIITFFMWILDKLTDNGHYPDFMKPIDPMQSSVFISNLGSLGLSNVPIHHLYDRGTSSLFITVGQVHKKTVITDKGPEEKYMVELGITMDERITDGYYLIQSLKLLNDIFENPDQLNERLKEYPIDS